MAFQRRLPQRGQQQQDQQYDNRNQGVLYVNDDKQQGTTDRDRQGKINVICAHCGVEQDYWLSAWDKMTRVGETISIRVGDPIEERGGQQRRVDQTNNFQRQNAAPRQPQQQRFAPRGRPPLPPQQRQRPSFDESQDDIPDDGIPYRP